jgi:CIC family chloride channel protein
MKYRRETLALKANQGASSGIMLLLSGREQEKINRMLERLRQQLASGDALMLAIIGLFSGLLAGAVILAFRQLVEGVQALFLADATGENYESLASHWRLLLPLGGGLLIGIVFQYFSVEERRVGIVHVLERLGYHQAWLPLRNAVLQFFGAATSIISGHSVGREGPGVHLGAATGSLLGQWLSLPNNSLRTLVACGAAASIAASFNTPLAGVVFAMEVILLEYSISGFVPVILASVSATWVTRLVYGAAPAFSGSCSPASPLACWPRRLRTASATSVAGAHKYPSGSAAASVAWRLVSSH